MRLAQHEWNAALEQFLKHVGLNRFQATLSESWSPSDRDYRLDLSTVLKMEKAGGVKELIDSLRPIIEDIKASEAAKPKRQEGFKTTSIGRVTPEVLLSQIGEVKWKGLIVIGIPEGEDPTGKGNFPFAYNSCGLNAMEFIFLVKHLEARASAAATDQEEVDPVGFLKDDA